MSDLTRWRGMIERDFSTSVMSDTKWQRFISAITSIPLFPAFRVKMIDEPVSTGNWELSFPYHLPLPYMCIEWLELNPLFKKPRGRLVADEVIDRSAEIERALRDARIPYTIEAGVFRVWGHVRRGFIPNFADKYES